MESVEENSFRLRDHLPLQQGLRPRHASVTCGNHPKLRDHLPLQQGLRLQDFNLRLQFRASETIFHYNKD